mgnify:CR=1 FL=1
MENKNIFESHEDKKNTFESNEDKNTFEIHDDMDIFLKP